MAVISAQYAKAQFVLREPIAGGKSFTAGPPIGMIPFLFNPKDYSMALQSGWTFKPSKKSAEPPEFTGNQMRTLDIEVFLDVTDVPQGTVAPIVELLFSTVRPTPASLMMNKPFPPIVMFTWGATPPFIGVVKSVNATMTLFQPTGLPVRATCKVSLQEFDPPLGGQNPTSGALRANSSHQVRLGDSLASIATAHYGNPTMWRAIASANQIEDPFNLRIGSDLLVPAPADAAELS
jgi:nucleoid-associated protein YgaU